MKKFLPFVIIVICGCSQIEVEENPLLFFWEEMDEKYVYFEEKNINWDSIRDIALQYNYLDTTELISGFNAMIKPLKDRHVWVSDGEESMGYSFRSFNNIIFDLRHYSESNIFINEYIYISQLANDIVYIWPKSFRSYFPDLKETLNTYNYKNGIIIDVRNNSGGALSACLDLASNFIQGEHTVLYQKAKNGHGHNDFTDYTPIKVEGSNSFQGIKTVVIADKPTYSAANLFVSVMKNITNSTIIGNITGGGAAISTHGILPNGWAYSISQQPLFDTNFRSLEPGVEPHYLIPFREEEFQEYISSPERIHPQMDYAYKLLLQ
jgi:hypothetical protein